MFWVLASFGLLALCAAWFWYGLAFSEEMTEQGKSLAAGSSGAGTGLLLGVPPLVFVHLAVLIPLLVIGAKYHSRPDRGVVLALIVVAVAGAVGIVLGQVLWGGCLFAMSAGSVCPSFVP